jgi:hypothetical protein
MYDALNKYKSQKKINFVNLYREAVDGGETDPKLILFRDEA